MSKLALIRQFFYRQFPFYKDGLEELLAHFELKSYPKGSILLREGQYEQKLRFLNKGSIREYYVSAKKETNIDFYTEPEFITDCRTFIQVQATKKNQESLVEVDVLELDKAVFFKYLELYSCGREVLEQMFQKRWENKELAEYDRITKSPEELYQKLLGEVPQWFQKIPQYHIASYLNITPETLSRIRKRIS